MGHHLEKQKLYFPGIKIKAAESEDELVNLESSAMWNIFQCQAANVMFSVKNEESRKTKLSKAPLLQNI